jgi:hypothetical protein
MGADHCIESFSCLGVSTDIRSLMKDTDTACTDRMPGSHVSGLLLPFSGVWRAADEIHFGFHDLQAETTAPLFHG